MSNILKRILQSHTLSYPFLPSIKHLFCQKFNYNAGRTNKSFNVLTKSKRFIDGFILPTRELSIMSEAPNKDFVIPNNQPVVFLECKTAFENLSFKEKAYAHHLSRACWYGGLIVLVQTSLESGTLFSILNQVFNEESVDEIKKSALEKGGLTEDEFQAIIVFISGVYTNMGNYLGFGDSKIVPNLPLEKLECVLNATKAFQSNPKLTDMWNRIKNQVYDLSQRKCHLGIGEKGSTTYFSDNCSSEDGEMVSQYLKSIHMEAYNSRVFKTTVDGIPHYEIRLASIESEPLEGFTRSTEIFEGNQFTVTRGDYSPLLKLVVEELLKAKDFASNATEVAMLDDYIKSFSGGRLDDHKNGSRHWVKNKGPVIETYIGFIETYRDPIGMRGEFEGFVAVVNRVMSAKFGALVNGAKSFLPLLPWPSTLEKDKFLEPDFTSLDVLTFASSGVPAGINIPNYGEIRQNEGFKNVSLGNVLPSSYKDPKIFFVSENDKQLLIKYTIEAFEVQVGLHELLGHGSGKLLHQLPDGSFNFETDSVQSNLKEDEILSWYEEGETYDSKFSSIASSYEECRAECVGLYLSLNYDVLKIFGYEGDVAEDIIYVNWLLLLLNGASKALEMYNPQTKVWMQAHSQARYVILQVLLEAGQGLISMTKTTDKDGQHDLLLSLDRSKISTVGKEALGNFLRKLQVYKSTGNVEAARAMYDKYSAVSTSGPYPFAEWRPLIMQKKQPRKMFVQSNTLRDGENVRLIEYEATHQGMIQSWKDRFNGNSAIYQALEEMWAKDQPYFS